jgi:L-rhamnose isomerase/sugar isomerase
MGFSISSDFIEESNRQLGGELAEDFDALGRQLARRGISIETIVQRAMNFSVAVPTWGVGTGGTRFARFPGLGEPRNIHEKLEDCGVINQLTRLTPNVSPHFPWDRVKDYNALRQEAASHALGFDAVNSNTFQDQQKQAHSYKFGSLTHADRGVRTQAIEHNVECIEIGRQLGSTALTVWIADGANFPGQSDMNASFDRYVDSLRAVYEALPANWSLFLEHKLYEPAFYATVIADWGSSLLAAQELGPKARCLVDLGHHAPTTNVEQIVSRLIRAKRLAGFHFNDSKYGDDDLDSGSIDPFRLFLVFNELVGAEERRAEGFSPAYMIDQSHNVTDPIESLMASAIEILRAYVQASLVDRDELRVAQNQSDVMLGHRIIKRAFLTDVTPVLAEARRRKGGAIDPWTVFRSSKYRALKSKERPFVGGTAAGIV